MNFDNEIYRILTEAGEDGLDISKISRHVLNACNSLFCPLQYDDVHKQVSKFLQKASRCTDMPIERIHTKGRYRLNTLPVQCLQMHINFQEGGAQSHDMASNEEEETDGNHDSAPTSSDDIFPSLF